MPPKKGVHSSGDPHDSGPKGEPTEAHPAPGLFATQAEIRHVARLRLLQDLQQIAVSVRPKPRLFRLIER